MIAEFFAAAVTFHGYPCTDDSSGHRAGYLWAQKRAITNEEDCPARSRSFQEGCMAWVENYRRPTAARSRTISGEATHRALRAPICSTSLISSGLAIHSS